MDFTALFRTNWIFALHFLGEMSAVIVCYTFDGMASSSCQPINVTFCTTKRTPRRYTFLLNPLYTALPQPACYNLMKIHSDFESDPKVDIMAPDAG